MNWRACFFALVLCACSQAGGQAPEQWRTVEVEVVPVAYEGAPTGRLVYRGGLDLRSADATFRGLSGLEVLDGGRLIAVGDESDWIEAELVLDEAGALAGLQHVRSAWVRNEAGHAFASKEEGDSEGLAQLPDGRFAVSFERTNLIRIYDLNRDGPFGAAAMGPRLVATSALRRNSGFEALAAFDNALVTGAEGGERATTPLWLAPLDAQAPVPPRFELPTPSGFSLTGMDRLPDGDFVAVERFYAPALGPRARIVRFPAEALRGDGGVIETEELALLESPFPVDNFESISAVAMPNGVTRLYLLSDNNGSARQRTLLLAFDVMEAAAD